MLLARFFILFLMLQTPLYAQRMQIENYLVERDLLEGNLVLEEYKKPIGFYLLERSFPKCYVGLFYHFEEDRILDFKELNWPLNYAYSEVIYDNQQNLIFLCPV